MTWSSEVLADSPLAWWRQADNNVGSAPFLMVDSSGNGRDGLYSIGGEPNFGQTSLVPTDANFAANYNGDHGQVADAAWMDVSTVTLEAWYKPANAPGAEEILFNRFSTTTAQRTWLMRRTAAGKLACYHYDTGGTLRVTTGATTLLQGVAYHLVVTIDSSGNVVLYVNGVSDGTGTYGVALRSASSANIRVGDYNGGVSTPAVGILDEVALYGTALSGTRVAAHYTAATVAPPNVPTSVSSPAQTTTTLDLQWAAPSGGGAVTSYQVRLDGGAPSTQTSPYTFTGLTSSTSYDLEVRAVGPGGNSAWVLVTVSTDSPVVTPQGYYRVELTLGEAGGPHVWTLGNDDDLDLVADYPHVRLPLTLGWDIADSVEFFPAQPSLTTLGFQIQCNDASDLADVTVGTHVSFRMYVNADPDADPWQTFNGIVTQLDGETVVSPADPEKRDFVVTVFCGDDNVRLSFAYVGWTANWPIEQIADRFDRICAEISATPDDLGAPHGLGMQGWLAARPAGAPITALSALQASIKDAADDYDSEPPDEFYGRYVFQYQPVDPDAWENSDPYVIGIYVFRRRVYDGGTVTLNGGFVRAVGRWQKLSGPAAARWNIVDGTTYGTPDASVPYVRNTSLIDYFGPGGLDPNYSAAERDSLGESLLSDGSTALDGWASRSLVYEASRDATANLDDVALWASPQHNRGFEVTPVVVTPIGPELEVNAVDYVAGTLTGARLVLPPGGRFTIEFRLRSELLPNTDLP